MELYAPSPQADMLIVQWWHRLLQVGDLERTFTKSALAISQFFALIQPPKRSLAYEADDQGIWMGFLLDPTMSAAFVALWLDPRKRMSRTALASVERCYEAALEEFPVLLGVTRQEKLLPEHERWGYEVLGRLPKIYDGDDGWIVTLTREGYDAARTKRPTRAEAA